VTEDTASDPTRATNIFQRMVEQEGINVATGPVSSDVGIQTSQVAQQLGVPLLLHMAGSTKSIEPNTRHTFRVGIHPALSFIRAQNQIIEANGYDRVGAIIAEYGWGNSVQSSIEEVMSVDINIQTASVGASDFRPFIRQFPEDLQMMISTGHPPGTISISAQMAELGYQPEITTGPSFPPAVLWGALGETAIDVNQTHVHITDVYGSRFQEVATAFAEENDARMDTHAGYGYLTGQLVAEAVRQSGSTDPEDITETIRGISFETIFPEPLQYADSGEIKDQRQLYSQFETGGPSYFPDGDWKLTEFFRTDPLPAIPAEA
jgi:branched-chain amino acid transport system substrate-binding protein